MASLVGVKKGPGSEIARIKIKTAESRIMESIQYFGFQLNYLFRGNQYILLKSIYINVIWVFIIIDMPRDVRAYY